MELSMRCGPGDQVVLMNASLLEQVLDESSSKPRALVETEGLSLRFGKQTILNEISIRSPKGRQ